jgi:integrase/recombinase XerD
MRPLRSLAIWLVEEGLIKANPFTRSRRRSALNPLLPSEDTPTKGATLADLQALERGCAGEDPLALRDQAIVAILKTTAARNSSVRLLDVGDIDFEREMIRFRRAKGAKTLEVALHREAAAAVARYLAFGRPTLVSGRSEIGSAPRSGFLFLSSRRAFGPQPLSMNAVSGMLSRRYHAGGGTLPSFGSHRIRHGTATLLANNGMPLDEVSRYLGHSSTMPTRRYAQQTADTLGQRAAEALGRAGLVAPSE